MNVTKPVGQDGHLFSNKVGASGEKAIEPQAQATAVAASKEQNLPIAHHRQETLVETPDSFRQKHVHFADSAIQLSPLATLRLEY